jgi:DNA-binding transcriptional LysR family regulator
VATCAGARYHLDVDVSFHETHELPTAVRQGECDAGMVAWPAPAAELSSALLWEEPRVAILPASHPLASAPAPLPLAQLALEPVARWPHLPVELDHYYQGLDTLAPVDQQRRPRVAGLAQALRLVELGRAITFLPSSVAQRFSRPGLAVRPVAGLSPNRMYLIWGHRNNSQELQHLLEICRATTPDAIVNTAS